MYDHWVWHTMTDCWAHSVHFLGLPADITCFILGRWEESKTWRVLWQCGWNLTAVKGKCFQHHYTSWWYLLGLWTRTLDLHLVPHSIRWEWHGISLVWQTGCFTVTAMTLYAADCQPCEGWNDFCGSTFASRNLSNWHEGRQELKEIEALCHFDLLSHDGNTLLGPLTTWWVALCIHIGDAGSWVLSENAYLKLCAWDLYKKPDLGRDTHIYSHKWRGSKWNAIIQGGFEGEKCCIPIKNL